MVLNQITMRMVHELMTLAGEVNNASLAERVLSV